MLGAKSACVRQAALPGMRQTLVYSSARGWLAEQSRGFVEGHD